MKTLNWKSTVMWTALSLLFLLLALMVGPAPALAGGIPSGVNVVLYEVTEDMYLTDSSGAPSTSPTHRSAVAQLSGSAKIGTRLCPYDALWLAPYAKECVVNASGSDLLALATGKGTVSGTFTVVIQDPNTTDAPEFVVMTGTFSGDADLSLAFTNIAPLGYITNGTGSVDGGTAFTFTGTFRLPFAVTATGKHDKPKKNRAAYYLADDFKTLIPVESIEKSLGFPTVRLEIKTP